MKTVAAIHTIFLIPVQMMDVTIGACAHTTSALSIAIPHAKPLSAMNAVHCEFPDHLHGKISTRVTKVSRRKVDERFLLACEAFWDDEAFPIAIKHAFSTTIAEDRGLRDVIIKIVSGHDSLVRKAEIQAVMLEHSDLAVGVLLKKAG